MDPVEAKSAILRTPAMVTVAWLVRLRWGAVLSQALTIGIATLVLKLALPLLPLLGLVLALALSNVALSMVMRRVDVSERTMGLVFCFDTLVLSGLLYFSGGPSNPFSVLYLIYIALSAVALGIRWSVGIVILSLVAYASLFFWHVPIAGVAHGEHAHHGHDEPASEFSVHLQGMWVAFAIAAMLIAFFVSRVTTALRLREEELAEARAMAARAERLASLTTLAAGAAHELGTPLGTIAVAAKELERTIAGGPADALADARLIRDEAARCRRIIMRLSARAGETMGELPEEVTPQEIFARCVARLDEAKAKRVAIVNGDELTLRVPPEGFEEVIMNLVQNALSASADGRVSLASTGDASSARIVVEDDGEGISPSVLSRVGEPFFTTKGPGEGMGLGVFLARVFSERWGGRLNIESRKGAGTKVTMELPRGEGRV